MTDIVFLLLIFFIILSTLVSPYGVKVDLPTGKVHTKDHPKIDVTINPGEDDIGNIAQPIGCRRRPPGNRDATRKRLVATHSATTTGI